MKRGASPEGGSRGPGSRGRVGPKEDKRALLFLQQTIWAQAGTHLRLLHPCGRGGVTGWQDTWASVASLCPVLEAERTDRAPGTHAWETQLARPAHTGHRTRQPDGKGRRGQSPAPCLCRGRRPLR